MLHLLNNREPWFRPKSHGYGSGLPSRWQGWVMLAAHVALIVGICLAMQDRPAVMAILALAAAVAPFPIYAARTEGGWHWRWGKAKENEVKPRR